MYIKTDYKDEYLRYLRDVGYSANTVRNLKSDMNSLYIWLQASNFQVTIDEVHDEYQRYLIVNKTPLHTMNRKLSSLSRFVLWLHSEYPSPLLTSPVKRFSGSRKAPNPNSYYGTFLGNASKQQKYFFGVLVTISLIVGLALLLRTNDPPSNPKKSGFSDIGSSNGDFTLQFDLIFSSPISLLGQSKSIILFSFFPQNDQSSSIGYVECPFENSVIARGSSRLKVIIDSNCGPLPSQVHDKIARNEAILTDIYLDDKKLTTSKVLLTNQKVANDELIDQGEMRDVLSKASKTSSLLPNSIISGNVLGSEVTSPSATLQESIPLSVFQNVSSLDDGDIVTIYNNEIIRALLSTEILGVKSSDQIIRKGVAYVHVVNTSDSPINVGDYISTSTTPGYGQKATNRYDSIVGVALESYTPGNSFLKVLMTTN
jgi:hypothetical protein